MPDNNKNPLSKISEISHQMGEVLALANSKKEWFLKQALNGFLVFVILLVFGCLDFVNLQFHIEYLLDIGYWSGVIAKVIAGVCAFNIGINIMWDTEIKKDIILGEQIVLYKKLMQYKQADFEYFVNKIFNPAEKKKAYVAKINKQIYWLNRISRRKDRLLYSSELPERQEEKLKNRYCVARAELEALKTDEYIAKNIDSLNVKFRPVDPASFELEVDGSSSYRGLKTVGSANMGKAKASANVVLGMLGFSMFLTAIGLEFNKNQFVDEMTAFFHYLLHIVGDVGVVAWQLLRGMLGTRKIVSSEFTQVYVSRNVVLTAYLEWRLKEKRPNTLVYDELHKEEKIVEITEEELKEITRHKEQLM